jgi:PIF1 helicase.
MYKFNISELFYHLTLTFPIIPAFAMTKNKSHGETFKKIAIFFNRSVLHLGNCMSQSVEFDHSMV